jgi:hypothetical protein
MAVAETGAYLAWAQDALSEEEQKAIVTAVAEDPTCGVLIPGMRGVRKLRWAGSGRGKRGGARVIHYFHSERMPVYLLAGFSKNERADLTPRQRTVLGRLVCHRAWGSAEI